MKSGFRCREGIKLLGADISNSLRLVDARVTGPEGKPKVAAVEMFRAEIGDLFMNGTVVEGGIYVGRIKAART